MFRSFIELFNSQEKLSAKWVLLLIFLFPIAGPVVRHWNSSIFVLFVFTALYFLITKKDRKILCKEEKIYLWTFFLFFCVFIVSTISNGYSWEKIQLEGLGTEIDFLLFIPIYLLIRRYDFSQKALLLGVLFSVPIIFLFSLYEYIYILRFHLALSGAYSPLFIGPIMALSLLMAFPAYKLLFKTNKYYWAIPPYIAMGLFTIVLSRAATAYLTVTVGGIILFFIFSKTIKEKIIGILLIILIAMFSYQISIVKMRTSEAIINITNYFKKENNINKDSSSGLRLEVWRSAQHIFKESPIVGIGNGNYPIVIKKYIDKGVVSPHVMEMGQAHNTFVEALISKGIIGLVLLLIIFYFPVYIAWKNKKRAHLSFVTVSTFASAITLISIGESMLINKNNGVAYLLIFSAVLFSSLINDINATKKQS